MTQYYSICHHSSLGSTPGMISNSPVVSPNSIMIQCTYQSLTLMGAFRGKVLLRQCPSLYLGSLRMAVNWSTILGSYKLRWNFSARQTLCSRLLVSTKWIFLKSASSRFQLRSWVSRCPPRTMQWCLNFFLALFMKKGSQMRMQLLPGKFTSPLVDSLMIGFSFDVVSYVRYLMPGRLVEKRPVAKIVESFKPPPTLKKFFFIFCPPAIISASCYYPKSLSKEYSMKVAFLKAILFSLQGFLKTVLNMPVLQEPIRPWNILCDFSIQALSSMCSEPSCSHLHLMKQEMNYSESFLVWSYPPITKMELDFWSTTRLPLNLPCRSRHSRMRTRRSKPSSLEQCWSTLETQYSVAPGRGTTKTRVLSQPMKPIIVCQMQSLCLQIQPLFDSRTSLAFTGSVSPQRKSRICREAYQLGRGTYLQKLQQRQFLFLRTGAMISYNSMLILGKSSSCEVIAGVSAKPISSKIFPPMKELSCPKRLFFRPLHAKTYSFLIGFNSTLRGSFRRMYLQCCSRKRLKPTSRKTLLKLLFPQLVHGSLRASAVVPCPQKQQLVMHPSRTQGQRRGRESMTPRTGYSLQRLQLISSFLLCRGKGLRMSLYYCFMVYLFVIGLDHMPRGVSPGRHILKFRIYQVMADIDK